MNISEEFDIKVFNEWYNKNFHKKIEIVEEVELLKDEILEKLLTTVTINGQEITIWESIITFLDEVLFNIKALNEEFIYDVFPETRADNSTLLRNNITKPTKSIINKMWRLNNNLRGMDYVSLENIKTRLKDLVRFSVRTNSLKNSEILAQKLNELATKKTNPEHVAYWESILNSIEVNTEMKTSTGYFAYHIYFKLKIGIVVELQVYSILSDSWKKLSHKIYEVVRDEINVKYNFNDIHSRIISIGHLLYLADCELYNLETELKKLN